MSPRNSPKTLFICSKRVILKLILDVLHNANDNDIKVMRDYLERELPFRYWEEFMNEIVYGECEGLEEVVEYFSDEERLRVVRLFLHREMKKLTMANFDEMYHNSILELIQLNCLNILYLDLSNISINNEIQFEYFKKILAKLPNLRFLCFELFNTDDLSECLIKDWPQHQNLRELNLLNVYNYDLIPIILDHFPNLEILRIYPFILRNLRFITNSKVIDLLRITEIEDSNTSLKAIKILQEMNPDLNSIIFVGPLPGVTSYLFNFPHLKNITLFSIHDFDEVDNVLTKCGIQLESLKVSISQGKINLTNILEKCPNLINLEISENAKVEIDTSRMVFCPKLIKFIMYQTRNFPTNMKHIILGLSSVEYLSIRPWSSITDSVIDHFMNMKLWHYLSFINLSYCPHLSSKSLMRLIEECPVLAHIHSADKWNISRVEYLRIKTTIKQQNYNCCLHCRISP